MLARSLGMSQQSSAGVNSDMAPIIRSQRSKGDDLFSNATVERQLL
jgi:hypothetical protein